MLYCVNCVYALGVCPVSHDCNVCKYNVVYVEQALEYFFVSGVVCVCVRMWKKHSAIP